MKKRVICILLIVLFCLAAVGCAEKKLLPGTNSYISEKYLVEPFVCQFGDLDAAYGWDFLCAKADHPDRAKLRIRIETVESETEMVTDKRTLKVKTIRAEVVQNYGSSRAVGSHIWMVNSSLEPISEKVIQLVPGKEYEVKVIYIENAIAYYALDCTEIVP